MVWSCATYTYGPTPDAWWSLRVGGVGSAWRSLVALVECLSQQTGMPKRKPELNPEVVEFVMGLKKQELRAFIFGLLSSLQKVTEKPLKKAAKSRKAGPRS